MIELHHVVKQYGAARVVDDLSFTVPPGTFCVLIGPSGCGKSTSLRLINRLIPLSAGSIRVGGTDIASVAPEYLRRRIGYAIQGVGLFPHWTIERNIATVPQLLGWPRSRIRDRVTELLELLRLPPAIYRSKYPHELSGGQQQRVGVARALAADPEVLLMDEPFGALDPVTRTALQAALRRIQQDTRKTVVFVTHDIDEALSLGDRIAIMERGRLVQFDTPAMLLERPASAFVRDFVGAGDIGIRLLTVRKVGERLRPGAACSAGPPIAAAATLREAMARMVAEQQASLAVVDDAGQPLGAIHLCDLLR